MAATAEVGYYQKKAEERQYATYDTFLRSLQRRLARKVDPQAASEWITETEQWIRYGNPAIGAPPLRVKELESGSHVIDKCGQVDLGHPVFPHPPDVLQGISLSTKLYGQELADIPYVDERTFFGRSTDRSHNIMHTVVMLQPDNQGKAQHEVTRDTDYELNTWRLGRPDEVDSSSRFIVINYQQPTQIYYNYYVDFHGIAANETISLGSHVVFSRYSQLYLHGAMANAFDESSNNTEKDKHLNSYTSLVRSFNQQDKSAKTNAALRRMTIPGYYR